MSAPACGACITAVLTATEDEPVASASSDASYPAMTDLVAAPCAAAPCCEPAGSAPLPDGEESPDVREVGVPDAGVEFGPPDAARVCGFL